MKRLDGCDPCAAFPHPLLYGSIWTGQSLALGATAIPQLPNVGSLGFNSQYTGGTPVPAFFPAAAHPPGLAYPFEVSDSTGVPWVTNIHARAANEFELIGPGTATYQASLDGISDLLAWRTARACTEPLDIVFPVVHITHGESDSEAGDTTDYRQAVLDWCAAFDTDIKALTGQTDDVWCLIDQVSSRAGGWNGTQTQPVLDQLQASIDGPLVVLVTPKYQFTYNDTAHLDNVSSYKLGELHALAAEYQIANPLGPKWTAPYPASVNASGTSIVLDYVPTPGGPLTLDTTNPVISTAAPDYGFAVAGVNITNVAVTGADQVTITVDAAPAAGAEISYGMGGTGASPVNDEGDGNLRGSTVLKSSNADGSDLFLWAANWKAAV